MKRRVKLIESRGRHNCGKALKGLASFSRSIITNGEMSETPTIGSEPAETQATEPTPPQVPTSAPKQPPYLANNNWEQELNFKLWSTKGARFQADKRCTHLSRLSQYSTSLLTAYVIIIGLMPYFTKSMSGTDMGDVISYISSSISIILLAYSLIESFQGYDLRAHLFHQNGLEISRLYNRLRQAKAKPETEKNAELRAISEEYELALERCGNHEGLDYEVFQTLKPDYFELTTWDCRYIRFKYFWKVRFRHYAIMIFPPIAIIWMLLYGLSHPCEN